MPTRATPRRPAAGRCKCGDPADFTLTLGGRPVPVCELCWCVAYPSARPIPRYAALRQPDDPKGNDR